MKVIYYFIAFICSIVAGGVDLHGSPCSGAQEILPDSVTFDAKLKTSKLVGFKVSNGEYYLRSFSSGSITGVWDEGNKEHTVTIISDPKYNLAGVLSPGRWRLEGHGAHEADFEVDGAGDKLWYEHDFSNESGIYAQGVSGDAYTRTYTTALYRRGNVTEEYDSVSGSLTFTLRDRDTIQNALTYAVDRGGSVDPITSGVQSHSVLKVSTDASIEAEVSSYHAKFEDLCPGRYRIVSTFGRDGEANFTEEQQLVVADTSRDYTVSGDIPLSEAINIETRLLSVVAYKEASCESGQEVGDWSYDIGSVDIGISMGHLNAVESAGSLYFHVESLASTSAYKKEVLSYLNPDDSQIFVKEYATGAIRQILSPELLVDVVDDVGNYGFYVDLYDATAAGLLYDDDGNPESENVYQIVNGHTWHTRYHFSLSENADGMDELTVEQVKGSTTRTIRYVSAGSSYWKLIEGDGIRIKEKEKSVLYDKVTTNLYSTGSLGEASLDSVVEEDYDTYMIDDVQYRRLVSSIEDPGGDNLETKYHYNLDNINYKRSLGKLRLQVNPDGSWVWYQYNVAHPGDLSDRIQSFGNHPAPDLSAELSSFADQNLRTSYAEVEIADLNSDTEEETLKSEHFYQQGQLYAASYTVEYSGYTLEDGQQLGRKDFIRCVDPSAEWNDATNLTTQSCNYITGLWAGQLRWRINPDGTGSSIQRNLAEDGTLTVTRYDGSLGTEPLAEDPLIDGVKVVTITSARGHFISELTYDKPEGGAYILVDSKIGSDLDSQGRPQTILNLDGTRAEQSYTCCGLSHEVSRTGNRVDYDYDDVGRVEYTTYALGSQNQQVEKLTYDGANRIKSRSLGANDASLSLVAEYDYDLAGRQTRIRTPYLDLAPSANRETTISEVIDADGFTIRTTTYPNSSTRIEKNYADGRPYEITGTATRHMRYAYGIELDSDLGYNVRTTTATYLDAGVLTNEYTKTYTDALGRQYKTIRPAADGSLATSSTEYNALGQRRATIEPDAQGTTLATIHEYDQRGALEVQALDISGDGDVTYFGATADRIVRQRTTYTTRTEESVDYAVFRRTVEVWPELTEDTPEVVATVDTTIGSLGTGLPGQITWSTQYNQTTRTELRVNAATSTQTITTTYPDDSYQVEVIVRGLLDSRTRYASDDSILAQHSYQYDASHGNRLEFVTDSLNGVTDYDYYRDGRPKSVTTTDPSLETEGPGYDRQKTSFEYTDDAYGIIRATILPDSSTRTEVFAPTGDLLAVRGSQTYPVNYSYDYAGRIRTQTTYQDHTKPQSAADTAWEYYSNGLLKQKWYDANIDSDGSISGTAGPSYTYTDSGRLKTKVNARGTTATYIYSPTTLDLTDITYDDGQTASVSFGYDRVGRTNTIGDASGTRTLDYHHGRLLDESYTAGVFAGYVIDRQLDALDRIEWLKLTQAAELPDDPAIQRYFVDYSYDAASRLQTVTSGTHTFTYGYDPAAELRQTLSFNNGTSDILTVEHRKDRLGRLSSITTLDGTSEVLNAHSYLYNDLNQRTLATKASGDYWAYTYDSLGQIESATQKDASHAPFPGGDFSYQFDEIGNRLSATVASSSTTYDPDRNNQYDAVEVPRTIDVRGSAAADATVTVNGNSTARLGDYFYHQLDVSDQGDSAQQRDILVTATLPDGGDENAPRIADAEKSEYLPPSAVVPQYDADGNLTDDGRWHYTWDAENRLIAMETLAVAYNAGSPRQKLAFAYDNQGRRFSKTVSDWDESSGLWSQVSSLLFLYDGWNLIAEINSQVSGLNLQASYIWGTDLSGSQQGAGGVGGLLAVTDSTGSTSYPAYDGSGNVVGYYDAISGESVAEFAYGPFGEMIRVTGSQQGDFYFRFSTKYEDPETGLLYYGYRYYDAAMGRWLSRDPLGEFGGPNLYGFNGNSAINYVDVLGMYPGQFIVDYWGSAIVNPGNGSFGGALVGVVEAAGNGVIQFPGDVRDGFQNAADGIGSSAGGALNLIQYEHSREELVQTLAAVYECLDDPCCRSALARELGESAVAALENYRDNPGQAVGEIIAALGSGGSLLKAVQKAKGITKGLNSINARNGVGAVGKGGSVVAHTGSFTLKSIDTTIKGAPGLKGVRLSGRVSVEDMALLQKYYQREFAQVYFRGPGKNGGGGFYALYSGDKWGISSLPAARNTILINHTHPAEALLRASRKDLNLLREYRLRRSPQRKSQVVIETGETFDFTETYNYIQP